jgi:hypothetical protein
MKRALRSAGAAAALCVLFCCAAQSSAYARAWNVPSECKHGVTGDEFDDPPVVDYYVNGIAQTDAVQGVTWFNGSGFATVFVSPHRSDIYLLAVSYTPFLIGTIPIHVQWPGIDTFRLPAAGFSSSAQAKVFDTYTVTINDLSGHRMPFASVLWTPFFNGSDPYITTADGNGQVVLECVQNLPAGYPVYIVSADGRTEFSTTINSTNSLLSANKSGADRSSNAGFGSN